MQLFSAYIPIDRRQQLITGQEIPATRLHGCALFVDISGFSTLSAKLEEELGERRGIEQITLILNKIYEVIISEIHRFGGSVIGFSGDAVTCWFNEDRGLRAIASATHIRQRLEEEGKIDVPNGDPIAIGVKAAVSAGRARRFTVGLETQHYVEILAGGIIDRLSDAEQVAKRGDIILTRTTIESLQDEITYETITSADGQQFGALKEIKRAVEPAPWPSDYLVSPEVARPWMLAPVYERLLEGHGNYLADLRNVVSLFIAFRGIDYEDEAAPEKLDELARWVQTILATYNGYLMQITMGDKGGYLQCVFGSPVAIENATEKAGRTALALQQPPASLDYLASIHIGISLGKSRTGAFGGSMRMTYGTFSNQINLSARLMGKAEAWQTVISSLFYEDAKSLFTFRPLGEFRLKGLLHPEPLYELTGVQQMKAPAKADVPLLGRAAEKAKIVAALQQLVAQEGSMTLIYLEGEAGIGKSKLINAIHEESVALGVETVFASGDITAQNRPYFVWRSVLYQLLKIPSDKQPATEENRAKLIASVSASDDALLEFIPILNDIVNFGLEETKNSAQITGETRANLIYRLMIAVVDQMTSQRPYLFVFDDGHYFDSASLALLRETQQSCTNLCILLASRPLTAPYSSQIERMRVIPGFANLPITHMSNEAIIELICYRLAVDALPPAISRLMENTAEGNPFFAEELAYALRDGQFITIHERTCELTTDEESFSKIPFPNRVEDVVTSRIDRLPAREQLSLKVASVIGRIFSHTILHSVHPVKTHKEQLEQILDQLQALNMTLLESVDPESTYIFKHIITRDVAYDMLLFGQKQELHSLIAEWYENNFQTDLSSYYSILADHWQQTDNLEKKLFYFELAGNKALETFASREAAIYFEELLKLRPPASVDRTNRADLVQVGSWLRKLGQAYTAADELDAAHEKYSQAAELLGYPEPAKSGTLGRKVLRQFLRQLIHRRFPRFRRPRRHEYAPLLAEVSRVYYQLSLAYRYTASVLEPVYALLLSLNLAEKSNQELDVKSELSRGYAGVGASYIIALGNRKAADAYFADGKQIAIENNDLSALAWNYNLSGFVYFLGGYLKESIELMDEANRICRQISEYPSLSSNHTLASANYHFYGDSTAAIYHAEQAIHLGRQRNNPIALVSGLVSRGVYHLFQGELGEAKVCLNECITVVDKTDLKPYEGDAEGCLGLVSVYEGHIEEAWSWFKIGFAKMEQLPQNLQILRGHIDCLLTVMYLYEKGHLDMEKESAAALIEQSLVYQKKIVKQKAAGSQSASYLLDGYWLYINGKTKPAIRAWRKGVVLAERSDMHYYGALINQKLGQYLPEDDPEKESAHEKANQFFIEVNNLYYQHILV